MRAKILLEKTFFDGEKVLTIKKLFLEKLETSTHFSRHRRALCRKAQTSAFKRKLKRKTHGDGMGIVVREGLKPWMRNFFTLFKKYEKLYVKIEYFHSNFKGALFF